MMTRHMWNFGLVLTLAAVASAAGMDPVRFAGRVLDTAGKPVAGATVVVLPGNDQWDETPVTVPPTRTAVKPDGRFEVAADFPHARLGYVVVVIGPDGLPCAGWSHLETGRDFGEIKVDRACTLQGRVLDAEGREPLVDQDLRLYFSVKPYQHLFLSKAFRTDREGRFALNGLPAGTYLLRLDTEPYQIHEEFNLAGDYSVIEYWARKSGVVEGTVTDSLGRPAVGATVTLSDRPDVMTDAQGHYRFDRLYERYYSGDVTHPSLLPDARSRALSAELSEGAGRVIKCDLKMIVPGSVALTVEAPAPGEPVVEGVIQISAEALEPNGRRTGRSVVREVQVKDGRALVENVYPGLNELKLAGDQRGDYAVRVTVEAEKRAEAVLKVPRVSPWTLTVRDPRGRPVDGAQIMVGVVRPPPVPKKDQPLYGRLRGTTGADGRCVIPDVPTGHLVVQVTSTQYPPLRAELDFDAAAPGPGTELKLDAGFVLCGKVVDDEGHPVPGANVTASSRSEPGGDSFGMFAMSSSVYRRAVTGPDGRFAFPGFPRAAYTLRADAAALVPGQTGGDAPLGPEFAVDIQLSRGRPVAGTITDQQGAPVAGARLSLYGPRNGLGMSYLRNAQSDAQGRFRIEGVGTGRFSLTVSAPGGVLKQEFRTEVDGGAEDVKIVLAPPAKPAPDKPE